MHAGSPPRPRRNPESALSSLVIHNVIVGGHRTSVRLEPAMWDALIDIARQCRRTLHDIVTDIDRDRAESTLTAAIRVFIVDFYRTAAMTAAPPTEEQRRSFRSIDPPDPEPHHVV